MPRYQYRCKHCDEISLVHHLSDEIVTKCPQCNTEGNLIKILSSFHTTPSIKSKPRQATGAVTEDFIKDARGELKQQKQDLEKQR